MPFNPDTANFDPSKIEAFGTDINTFGPEIGKMFGIGPVGEKNLNSNGIYGTVQLLGKFLTMKYDDSGSCREPRDHLDAYADWLKEMGAAPAQINNITKAVATKCDLMCGGGMWPQDLEV